MNFLDSILRQKESESRQLPIRTDLLASGQSFITSLRSRRPSLIAEVKPRSPVSGVLFDRSKVSSLVKLYNAHAQAISVLCDASVFGGGYDLLAEVRQLTTLPILAKEFIVDARQIHAARVAGADAVLLIAALLRRRKAQSLALEAMKTGMGILFEVHTESDLARIPDLPVGSMVIGINNRNLSSLAIDLNTTERLFPILRSKYPNHLIVTESGIKTAGDVKHLNMVDGFLIGTGLLKQNSNLSLFDAFFRPSRPERPLSNKICLERQSALSVRGASIIPRIKICGVTRERDIDLCESLGIDYIGLNFIPSSKRYISLKRAKVLRSRMERAKVVGIFLGEQNGKVARFAHELGLDYVQVYGECSEKIAVPIIRAFRSVPSSQLLSSEDHILLDGSVNGEAADHEAIAVLPRNVRSRMFLAGGLTSRNVQGLIKTLQPFAVDVASGVESAPGIKDPEKLRDFVAAVRSST